MISVMENDIFYFVRLLIYYLELQIQSNEIQSGSKKESYEAKQKV